MKTLLTVLLATLLSGASSGQSLVREHDGATAGAGMGSDATGPGDLSGDGVPDVLVSAPGDDARTVWAFSGASGAYLWSLHGSAPGDGFGASITTVEDVDGDGFDEIAITAEQGGYTRLFSGSSHLPLHDWNVYSRRVLGLGDVDGDGAGDLIVAGIDEARVFSGATKAELHVLPYTHTNYVMTLGGGGDVDGDGHADFVVADSWASSSGGAEAGRVQVYSGFTGALLHVLDGVADYEWFGRQAAILGDVDGDGRDELAISASPDFLFNPKAPYVTVYSGADASALYTVGVQDVLSYGIQAVEPVGDVDGDGAPDFLMSWTGTETENALELRSGADGALVWRTTPPGVYSVDVVGDLDGDGAPEVVVGNRFESPNGAGSGTARVFRAACGPPPTSYCIGAPNSAGPGARLSFGGTPSLSLNELRLEVSGVVPTTFGLFFYGGGATQLPFGHGYRCVNAGGVGVFRLSPAGMSSGDGTAVRPLDFTAPPLDAGAGVALPGATHYYQYWYRDVPAGPPSFNLSDGLAVTYCP